MGALSDPGRAVPCEGIPFSDVVHPERKTALTMKRIPIIRKVLNDGFFIYYFFLIFHIALSDPLKKTLTVIVPSRQGFQAVS